jgi:AraC family transcriptional regulator
MVEFLNTPMKPPLLSVAQFAKLMPRPPITAAKWGACSILVVEPAVRATLACSDHVFAVQISGTCRLRRQANARSSEGWCGPGSVQVIPAGMAGSWEGSRHSGLSRAIALFVPRAFLSRVVADSWETDSRLFEMQDRFLADDPVITGMLTRLAREAGDNFPSGSLYAESACEFLAHHVIHSYSSLSTPPTPIKGGLPAHRLKIVTEFIEDNLGQPIALHQLATMAGVNARHFERAFRQATGIAPYAYVLKKRVDAARRILIDDPLASVGEIASRVGFSSGSHLAFAFRRQIGCTPTLFRQRNAR